MTLALDAVIGPRDLTGWPAVWLTVFEQESARRRCSWGRHNRYRTSQEVMGLTARETTAEHVSLSSVLYRRSPDIASLRRLARDTSVWAQRAHSQARADFTAAHAARARACITRR
ncbi:hypothetical protein [Streptomyces lydicus]|uniref:hypothetical protein n=1 Tax=Streptomyces lydicus TaxID=47763 RepID=UPI0036EEF5BB